MIERVAGGVALSIAAVVAAEVRPPVPVVLHFLGYPFEAAGMIAGLVSCSCALWWRGNLLRARKTFRWMVNLPISLMALAVAAGVVIAYRPEPLAALIAGAGIGVIGEGLFIKAAKAVEKFDLFGLGTVEAPAPQSIPPHPLPDDLSAMTRQFDEEPKA